VNATPAQRRTPLWTRVPGPFFFRDVRASGRRSSTYWTRAAYAGLMLVFVVIFFLVSQNVGGNTSVAAKTQQMQTFAPTLTMALAWVQFIMLWLIAAAMTGPAICDEVRAGTLATLLTTPLKAWEIVLGKLLGSLVQLGILTLMGAPLLLAIRVFGGVQAEMVVALTSLALSTAIMSASIGLFFSVYSNRPAGAISTAVFFGLGVMVFPLLGMVILNHFSIPLEKPLLLWIWNGQPIELPSPMSISAVMSPPMAMGLVTFELGGAMQTGNFFNITATWIGASLYALGIAGAALIGASLALRRRMATLGGGSGSERKPSWGRGARGRGVSRTVGDEPVIWRELRASGGARWLQITGVLLTIGLLVLAFWLGGTTDWEVHMAIGIIGTVVALALAVMYSSGGITGEREARTWEVLLTSPLTAKQIIMAKFIGAVRRQWFVAAAVLVSLGMMGVGLGVLNPFVLLHYTLVVGPALMAVCAMGVYLSLMRRKTASAASLNFGVWLGMWVIAPIVCGIVVFPLAGQVPGYEEFAEKVMLSVLTFNPVFQIGVGIEGAKSTQWSPGAQPYQYGPDNIGVFGFTGLCLVGAGVWVVFTGLILEAARRSLARRSQRRW